MAAHTLIELGGIIPVVDQASARINAVLRSLKNRGAPYVLGYEGLRFRCLQAASMLESMGLPELYWNGVEFYAYSRGPGHRYTFNGVIGIGAKVRRANSEWHLVDAYKTFIAKTEKGDPRFQPFTEEQWAQMPDPGDKYWK